MKNNPYKITMYNVEQLKVKMQNHVFKSNFINNTIMLMRANSYKFKKIPELFITHPLCIYDVMSCIVDRHICDETEHLTFNGESYITSEGLYMQFFSDMIDGIIPYCIKNDSEIEPEIYGDVTKFMNVYSKYITSSMKDELANS